MLVVGYWVAVADVAYAGYRLPFASPRRHQLLLSLPAIIGYALPLLLGMNAAIAIVYVGCRCLAADITLLVCHWLVIGHNRTHCWLLVYVTSCCCYIG